MFRFISKQRATMVGFLSLVLPLVLLWHHSRERPDTTIYQRILMRVTSPAQYVMGTVATAFRTVWSDYTWLVGVQQENRELRRKNEVMAGVVQDREQLRKENKRLKTLLAYKGERPDLVTISARVVAKDVSPFHRVLKIKLSAGSGQGVRRYQAVVTPSGVVGHVEKTLGDYAEVKLAVDAGSRISVNVEGKEIKGLVAGSGDRNTYTASFETVDQKRQIRPGDMLVTNGEDERFPKGLVVGYVHQAPPTPEEAGLRYEVIPAVAFATLEEVLIITSQVERIPSMEEGGRGP